ncbi:MAG: glycoside hydrolase family 68 protein [Thermoleophilia bacterium]
MTVHTGAWLPGHLAVLDAGTHHTAPVITREQVVPIVPGVDVWDLGPVRTPDGRVARHGGTELWIAISAPAEGDPGGRHDIARLRLLTHWDGRWGDAGPLFPDGASLGSREWAASATLHPDGRLEVLYTAAGARDGSRPRFDQCIVAADATLAPRDGTVALRDWTPHRVVLRADGATYMPTDSEDGEPGFIKAFRDPFPVRDGDGADWMLFAASQAGATSAFNGAVGVARADGAGGWVPHPPLLTADGVNNELERPHLVRHDDAWYLFFSTQRRTFAPGVDGPSGLYGFVAPALLGPYRPLNGSGLVLRNPPQEPLQAYSWLVLPDLRVASFIDAHSLDGRSPEEIDAEGPEASRRHFGGTIAPILRLHLDGERAALA